MQNCLFRWIYNYKSSLNMYVQVIHKCTMKCNNKILTILLYQIVREVIFNHIRYNRTYFCWLHVPSTDFKIYGSKSNNCKLDILN